MPRRSSEYKRRAAVQEALRAGKTRMEIVEFLKVPKSTVYDIAKRYYDDLASQDGPDEDKTASPARKKRSEAPNKKRMPDFLQQLQELIEEDPMQSMRQLAIRLDVSECTVRRAVHQDLRYKSYTIRIRQLLTETMKAKRVTTGTKLLSSLKHEATGRIKIFSDEKIFTVDSKTNRRNTRCLCQFPDEVPIAMKTKFPASVMVLGVVTSNGDVMPPHFFGDKEKVNTEVYIKALEEVVKPWVEEVTAGASYVFQQDSAPAHAAKKTQEWCEENLDMVWTKEFWPPNFPGLNPLDYYVWGEVERQSNKKPHNSKEALKTAIREAMGSMEKEVVIRACSRFRSRLEKVIEVGGGFIE